VSERDPYRVALARLQAYFPTPALPPSSVAMWLTELRRWSIEDVAEAVEILGHVGTGGRPLAYAQVESFVEDVARARMTRAQPPLPTPEDFRELAPPEVSGILDAYWSAVGDERRRLAEARSGRESADPARRVEAVRRLAAARIAAESERREEHTAAAPVSRGGSMRTACGAAVGSHAVQRGGRWVCPTCGSPVEDGCLVPA
jgi:hypothetical protein